MSQLGIGIPQRIDWSLIGFSAFLFFLATGFAGSFWLLIVGLRKRGRI